MASYDQKILWLKQETHAYENKTKFTKKGFPFRVYSYNKNYVVEITFLQTTASVLMVMLNINETIENHYLFMIFLNLTYWNNGK